VWLFSVALRACISYSSITRSSLFWGLLLAAAESSWVWAVWAQPSHAWPLGNLRACSDFLDCSKLDQVVQAWQLWARWGSLSACSVLLAAVTGPHCFPALISLSVKAVSLLAPAFLLNLTALAALMPDQMTKLPEVR
jgi:hypothetical protein